MSMTREHFKQYKALHKRYEAGDLLVDSAEVTNAYAAYLEAHRADPAMQGLLPYLPNTMYSRDAGRDLTDLSPPNPKEYDRT